MVALFIMGGLLGCIGLYLAYMTGYRQGKDHFDMERRFEKQLKMRRAGR